ncbi:MAG: carboxy terminal-processing peptidase [Verrucomicrobiota bacterium]
MNKLTPHLISLMNFRILWMIALLALAAPLGLQAEDQATATETDVTEEAAPAPEELKNEDRGTASRVPSIREETGRVRIQTPREKNRGQNGQLANVVMLVLENLHYRQQKYDDAMSELQLRNYMEELDFRHMIFKQSDYDEFRAKFGENLDDITRTRSTAPAFEIFNRYVERLEERKDTIEGLLEAEPDFTVEEDYLVDREDVLWPGSEEEAQEIWRKHIKAQLLDGKLKGEDLEETRNKISKRLNTIVQDARDFEEQDVLKAYLNALTQSYDPHSDYFTKEDLDNFNIHNIDLKLTGIGAVLQSDDGYAKIQRLVAGGPAAKTEKLLPGDRIVAVAQGMDGEAVDVVDMKLNKVVELIRGKRGSTVRLTVIPADAADPSERKVVNIVRDEIELKDMQATARVYESTDEQGNRERIGVVTLPQFYKLTVAHVAKLVKELNKQGVNGIILDLRNNGGGLLDQAIQLTGLFIDEGPVVQVKSTEGYITPLEDDDRGALYQGPLMVLVGHLSASASEIVAAALQDYGRALIVGDSATHGKGTVQQLMDLNRWMPFGVRGEPGGVKVTVNKFYRVAGGSTQQKGVVPDIHLPSIFDFAQLGERYLPNHLPYDEVQAVPHDQYDLVGPYLDQLRELSVSRVEADPEFTYVFEDIEELKRKIETKTVSLNEAARLAEKSDREARREKRKEERAARPKAKTNIYELTIEMIDQGEPMKLIESGGVKVEDEEDAELAKLQIQDEDSASDRNKPDAQLLEAIRIMLDYATAMVNNSALAKNASQD